MMSGTHVCCNALARDPHAGSGTVALLPESVKNVGHGIMLLVAARPAVLLSSEMVLQDN